MKPDWSFILKRALAWIGIGSAAISSVSGQALGALPEGTATGAARPGDPLEPLTFERPNHNDGLELFAAHSSHASHSSHYSGAGASASPRPSAPSATPADPSIPQGTSTTAVAKATQQDKELMVLRLQAQLHQLGYYGGIIDGQFGSSTRDAIRRYQLVKGLPETSAMDDATLASLGIVY